MGFSIRDGKTVQRRIGESSTVTDGIRIFRMSPTMVYNISEALEVSLYYERNVNDPRVSTSFLNARTAFGGRIRFNLSQ
jgi:cell surface protein SprA